MLLLPMYNLFCLWRRYLNNHLNSTLTVCWKGKPGHHLKAKLCDYLRPKCHPIFFDLNINTAAVVRLNIFQAFLLCAMKFHCYICHLSYMCKFSRKFLLNIILRSLRSVSYLVNVAALSSENLCNIIFRCLLNIFLLESFMLSYGRYMDVLIKNRMSSIQLDLLPRPRLQLEDGEVEWLGLNAYVQALTRKQARHARLLSLLKSRLIAHQLSGCISSDLIYAVDRSHSSLLWKIKY